MSRFTRDPRTDHRFLLSCKIRCVKGKMEVYMVEPPLLLTPCALHIDHKEETK